MNVVCSCLKICLIKHVFSLLDGQTTNTTLSASQHGNMTTSLGAPTGQGNTDAIINCDSLLHSELEITCRAHTSTGGISENSGFILYPETDPDVSENLTTYFYGQAIPI